MKKIILIFLILTKICFSNENKIGLVLAGGGAKGFAHVGVLKVIEEEQIPIDYIVGTSMGSIIGGLYAMGYTASELEEIVLSKNWMQYFDERVVREDTLMEEKYYNDRFMTKFAIEDYQIKLPKGALKGQYIETLFNELFSDAYYINDFSELPIPFACVATDVETGDKVILKKGNLAKSIRASMSIPGVFTPVEIDGRLLLDGMLVSNFPVEIAKDMGADIIIGSDLVVELKKRDELNSAVDVLDQSMNYQMIEESNRKAEMVDLLIVPDLKGLTTVDYDKAKLLIDAGEKSAREKIKEFKKYSNPDKFIKKRSKRLSKIEEFYIRKIEINGNEKYSSNAIKKMLSLDAPLILKKTKISKSVNALYALGYFEKVTYSVVEGVLKIEVEEKLENELKFGFNYNSENFGELYFNFTKKGVGRLAHELKFDTSIGKDEYYQLKSRRYIGDVNRALMEAGIEYSNINQYELYGVSKKIGEVDLKKITLNLSIGTSFAKKNRFMTGIRKNISYVENLLESNNVYDIPEDKLEFDYIDYYVEYNYDSLDNLYFPRKGRAIDLQILRTNKSISDYEFLNYKMKYLESIKLHEKWSLNLCFDSNILHGGEALAIITPSLGGFQNRKDSIEFWGLSTSQYFSDKIWALSSEALYEFATDKFVTCRYNVATYDEDKTVEGVGVGIGILTMIGPINIIATENSDDDLAFYLNIGYYF